MTDRIDVPHEALRNVVEAARAYDERVWLAERGHARHRAREADLKYMSARRFKDAVAELIDRAGRSEELRADASMVSLPVSILAGLEANTHPDLGRSARSRTFRISAASIVGRGCGALTNFAVAVAGVCGLGIVLGQFASIAAFESSVLGFTSLGFSAGVGIGAATAYGSSIIRAIGFRAAETLLIERCQLDATSTVVRLLNHERRSVDRYLEREDGAAVRAMTILDGDLAYETHGYDKVRELCTSNGLDLSAIERNNLREAWRFHDVVVAGILDRSDGKRPLELLHRFHDAFPRNNGLSDDYKTEFDKALIGLGAARWVRCGQFALDPHGATDVAKLRWLGMQEVLRDLSRSMTERTRSERQALGMPSRWEFFGQTVHEVYSASEQSVGRVPEPIDSAAFTQMIAPQVFAQASFAFDAAAL